MNQEAIQMMAGAVAEAVPIDALANWMEQLVILAQGHGDQQRVERVLLLLEKRRTEARHIVFLGHFSAGKSSLMNALAGVSLPTSPLPTSANLVFVSHGEPRMVALFRDGTRAARVGDDDEARQLLAAWSTDARDVVRIDVTLPVNLPAHFVLVDTPGVDSTDVRHEEATKHALFLADVIVFVTDYNHVLAEDHLRLLRALLKLNRPLFFVVNQIDKHNAWELSFEWFAENVRATLQDEGMDLTGVYFVSALHPEMPDSELFTFKDQLEVTLDARDEQARFIPALMQLLEEHRAWCVEQANAASADALTSARLDAYEPLEGVDASEVVDPLTRLTSVVRACEEAKEHVLHAQETSAKRVSSFQETLDGVVNQAILLPYHTTELAVRFVEAQAPNFRVGFLSTSAKVEREREARRVALTEDVAEKFHTGIIAHLRQIYLREMQEGVSFEEKCVALFERLEQCVNPAWVTSHLAAGALTTESYGYQYAKTIDAALRSTARAVTRELASMYEVALKKELDEQTQSSRALLDRLQPYLPSLCAIEETANLRAEACAALARTWQEGMDVQ